MGDDHLTRRQLLRRGGVLAAGIAVLAAPSSASAAEGRHRKRKRKRKLAVYKLVTRDRHCTKRQDRRRLCACSACYSHARYKLFPTRKAADGNRAHQYCNCRIKKAGKVKRSTYVALFGKPNDLDRYVVDRRKKRVKRILRRG